MVESLGGKYMPKINQEEYETLKELDDRWKWIARDEDGVLGVYDAKVIKTKFHNYWIMAIKKKIDASLFSFIQWEDEEPHNIAELIKEYESQFIETYNVQKELEELDRLEEYEEMEE